MKTAWLDCATGVAGDMMLAALIDAGADEDRVRRAIASLDLPGVELRVDEILKGCFRARQVRISHPEQHAHRHLAEINKLIDNAQAMTDRQRQLAKSIFLAVARAEATVHGADLESIHFHEVGAIDSIVDIVGVAVAFDSLQIERLICAPVPVGFGRILIDHGVCSIPAPGTAELLKGIPLAEVPVEGELTTPTGAAIVSVLADGFGNLPQMTIEEVGYGAGTMDFPDRANILRLIVGQAVPNPESDLVCLLETNLDDVSGEVVGYAKEKLLAAGALDVFSTATQMKKNRPGVILSVLCLPQDQQAMEEIVFAETETLGIRKHLIERTKRTRTQHIVDTTYGPVAGKLAARGGARPVFTPEFEDCARLAAEHGIPLRQVYRAAEAAMWDANPPTIAQKSSDSHTHDHDHSHSHDHSHDHHH